MLRHAHAERASEMRGQMLLAPADAACGLGFWRALGLLLSCSPVKFHCQGLVVLMQLYLGVWGTQPLAYVEGLDRAWPETGLIIGPLYLI